MQRYLVLAGIPLLVVMVAMPVDAAVTVSFVPNRSLADAGPLQAKPSRAMLEIQDYLTSLGSRYLPPQDTLAIEVLDIDFAGGPRGSQYANADVRAFTGDADWPRIDLRYTLQSPDGTARRVQETVVDMAYLRPLDPKYASASLPYEKRMLDGWFKARFVEHQPAH